MYENIIIVAINVAICVHKVHLITFKYISNILVEFILIYIYIYIYIKVYRLNYSLSHGNMVVLAFRMRRIITWIIEGKVT